MNNNICEKQLDIGENTLESCVLLQLELRRGYTSINERARMLVYIDDQLWNSEDVPSPVEMTWYIRLLVKEKITIIFQNYSRRWTEPKILIRYLKLVDCDESFADILKGYSLISIRQRIKGLLDIS